MWKCNMMGPEMTHHRCYEAEAMLKRISIGFVLTFLVALSVTQKFAIGAKLRASDKTTLCNNVEAKKYGKERGVNTADAYEFGLRIQNYVEMENLQGLFSLVRGELRYGPRKKYIQEKIFSDIFSSEWREQIITVEPSCIGDYEGRFTLRWKIWYEQENTWRNGVLEKGDWTIFSIHSDQQPEPSKSPPEGSWNYHAELLTSICFTTMPMSSDNYKAYYEKFIGPRDKNYFSKVWEFYKNIGQYIGGPVPVAPIVPPWSETGTLALAVKLSGCVKREILTKTTTKDEWRDIRSIRREDGWVKTIHCSKHGAKRCLVEKYRLLKRISLKHCGLLAPYFAANCIDLGLVQISQQTGGSMGNKNDVGIYGIIREPTTAEVHVIPLVNFDHLNDALNYVDQLDR